jgi:DHA1 family tetracycline resistance protein-like MFS transporter
VLLVALAGSTASLLLMGLAPAVWVLVAARLVAGACGGSIGVAHALVADLTAPQDRTRAMARVGMAIGAAFTIGPLIGALGGTAGLPTMAVAGATLAASAWLLAWRALPDPEPRTAAPAAGPAQLPRALLAVAFLGMCALVGMETTVALLAGDRFAAGPGYVGVLLCLAGLAMTLAQTPLLSRARRWGDARVATASAALMAAGLAAMPMAGAVGLAVAVVVVAAGQAVLATTTTSLLSRAVDADRRGAVLGRAQAMAAAGRLVGPVAAGGLADVALGLPFMAGAALAVVAALAVQVGRPRPVRAVPS